MDVRAIVLVGPDQENETRGQLGGVPIALLDVLGAPVVHRVVERLQRFGIHQVAVVCECAGASAQQFAKLAARPDVSWSTAAPGEMWRAAEQAFSEFAQNGAELVLALRLGPYAELDWEHLIQFHLDRGARVTSAVHGGREFGAFVISASRRNDAAFLFRHRFRECRVPCTQYPFEGVLNPLEGAADLRALAREGLLLRNDVAPRGRQLRPGVWAAEGARIDRGARVLAPAFIGARARVRATAVVTRCAALEHHAHVDCGSVVEDSTVLPFATVGAGLDVTQAVVGFRCLYHLRRGVAVEFADPQLIGMASLHAPVRALASAASLAAFLPTQFFQGLFGKSRREQPADLPAAVQQPSAALQAPAIHDAAEPAAKFPSNLAVARRYGNE